MNNSSFSKETLSLTKNKAQDDALLRAYPISRCLDYGCAIDDVLRLQHLLASGYAWRDVTVQLADINVVRAELENKKGFELSASRFYLYAAACYRLAQIGLEYTPGRADVYQKQANVFAQAMQLSRCSCEYFEIPHHEKNHPAWLYATENTSGPAPCILIWGGADGWCEAFYPSIGYFLERGLSVCLLELPGQGLSRICRGSFLDSSFTEMITTALDLLASYQVSRFGLIGHSFGGSLALKSAAADSRITAVCTNGGSIDPYRGIRKYPRVEQRVASMLGDKNFAVSDFMKNLDLSSAVGNLQAELLCLHGQNDSLVEYEEIQLLQRAYSGAGITVKVWDDGTHCLYNHSVERNWVMANWFSEHLSRDVT